MAYLCDICRRPSFGRLCELCFARLYPEAAARHADTQDARAMDRAAEAYERAHEADEADAPVKHRGPS